MIYRATSLSLNCQKIEDFDILCYFCAGDIDGFEGRRVRDLFSAIFIDYFVVNI